MHSRLHYSFLAFVVSALIHAGLWGAIISYKTDEKPKPIENIVINIAMFKPAEKAVANKSKPASKPKSETKAIPNKEKYKKKAISKLPKKKLAKKKPKKALPKQQRPTSHPVRALKKQQPKSQARFQPKSQPKHSVTTNRPVGVTNPVAHSKTQQRPAPKPTPPVTNNPQLEKQYGRSVQQKIEQKKNYPRRAKRRQQQGVTKVGFTLNKNGVIANLRIVQSSGFSRLDNATLQAVKQVGRFPAFPAGITKQSIRYIIPVSYRL